MSNTRYYFILVLFLLMHTIGYTQDNNSMIAATNIMHGCTDGTGSIEVILQTADISFDGGLEGDLDWFSFEWSNGDEENLIQNNLEPGDYSITVTNLFGCMETAYFTIHEINSCGFSIVEQYDPCTCTVEIGVIASIHHTSIELTGADLNVNWIGLDGGGELLQTVSTMEAGYYQVSISAGDGGCCVFDHNFIIEQYPCASLPDDDIVVEKLIVNETNQAEDGSCQYVELLVVGNCECSVTRDIRGLIVDDNNGEIIEGNLDVNYQNREAIGINSGFIQFSNDAQWADVPIGSIILIVDENDPCSIYPEVDKNDDDGDQVYVLHAADPDYFTGKAGSWNAISQAMEYRGLYLAPSWSAIEINSSADAIQVRYPNGDYMHGIGFGESDYVFAYTFPLWLTDLPAQNLNNRFVGEDHNVKEHYATDLASVGLQSPGLANSTQNEMMIESYKECYDCCIETSSTLTADGLTAYINDSGCLEIDEIDGCGFVAANYEYSLDGGVSYLPYNATNKPCGCQLSCDWMPTCEVEFKWNSFDLSHERLYISFGAEFLSEDCEVYSQITKYVNTTIDIQEYTSLPIADDGASSLNYFNDELWDVFFTDGIDVVTVAQTSIGEVTYTYHVEKTDLFPADLYEACDIFQLTPQNNGIITRANINFNRCKDLALENIIEHCEEPCCIAETDSLSGASILATLDENECLQLQLDSDCYENVEFEYCYFESIATDSLSHTVANPNPTFFGVIVDGIFHQSELMFVCNDSLLIQTWLDDLGINGVWEISIGESCVLTLRLTGSSILNAYGIGINGYIGPMTATTTEICQPYDSSAVPCGCNELQEYMSVTAVLDFDVCPSLVLQQDVELSLDCVEDLCCEEVTDSLVLENLVVNLDANNCLNVTYNDNCYESLELEYCFYESVATDSISSTVTDPNPIFFGVLVDGVFHQSELMFVCNDSLLIQTWLDDLGINGVWEISIDENCALTIKLIGTSILEQYGIGIGAAGFFGGMFANTTEICQPYDPSAVPCDCDELAEFMFVNAVLDFNACPSFSVKQNVEISLDCEEEPCCNTFADGFNANIFIDDQCCLQFGLDSLRALCGIERIISTYQLGPNSEVLIYDPLDIPCEGWEDGASATLIIEFDSCTTYEETFPLVPCLDLCPLLKLEVDSTNAGTVSWGELTYDEVIVEDYVIVWYYEDGDTAFVSGAGSLFDSSEMYAHPPNTTVFAQAGLLTPHLVLSSLNGSSFECFDPVEIQPIICNPDFNETYNGPTGVESASFSFMVEPGTTGLTFEFDPKTLPDKISIIQDGVLVDGELKEREIDMGEFYGRNPFSQYFRPNIVTLPVDPDGVPEVIIKVSNNTPGFDNTVWDLRFVKCCDNTYCNDFALEDPVFAGYNDDNCNYVIGFYLNHGLNPNCSEVANIADSCATIKTFDENGDYILEFDGYINKSIQPQFSAKTNQNCRDENIIVTNPSGNEVVIEFQSSSIYEIYRDSLISEYWATNPNDYFRFTFFEHTGCISRTGTSTTNGDTPSESDYEYFRYETYYFFPHYTVPIFNDGQLSITINPSEENPFNENECNCGQDLNAKYTEFKDDSNLVIGNYSSLRSYKYYCRPRSTQSFTDQINVLCEDGEYDHKIRNYEIRLTDESDPTTWQLWEVFDNGDESIITQASDNPTATDCNPVSPMIGIQEDQIDPNRINERIPPDLNNDIPNRSIQSNFEEVTIYPNPFFNNLNVKIESSLRGTTRIVIQDINGRQVYQTFENSEVGSNSYELSLENLLEPGVYYLQTILPTGKLITQKIVFINPK